MAFQIANVNTVVTINTGNSNLDGTRAISLAFTASGTFGSVLSSMRINTQGAVQVGMVRIFFRPNNASNWHLFKEVMIPESPLNDPPYPVFACSVELNLSLGLNNQIGVSTQTNNIFNIQSIGYDITGFI